MNGVIIGLVLASWLICYPAVPDAQPQAAPADGVEVPLTSSIVTPIFTEGTYRVTRPRDIARGRLKAVNEEIKSVAFGSAFSIRSGDRLLLVTAAHVVRPPSQIESITSSDGTQYDTKDGNTIELISVRTRVGGVSARPSKMLVDDATDVALIELDPQDLRSIGIEPLTPGTTKRDAEVKFWGFPAIARTDKAGRPLPAVPSASQVSQRTDVTDVRASEIICAPLNGVETRGGFSGGPIVDPSGRAVVGMIMRSTPETTRCRSIAVIQEFAKTFEAKASPTP